MLPEYPISVPTYDCSDYTSYEYSQFTSAFTYNIPSVDIHCCQKDGTDIGSSGGMLDVNENGNFEESSPMG